ncbi:MAG TPA: ABC transporter permease subunit [Thermoanaerobaculia bacterium]|nr:ABC transporter permease subunit [Thermoanaerobaculia bacterium]
MRVVLANIEEVFREAAARWTLIAYFVLSSLFIITFASAVNLDVVDGALAGAKLFGQQVHMNGGGGQMDELVLSFESKFSTFLYVVGIFLAIFSTAHLVPRLQEKGTIDLYLSRPVARTKLLLSRYIAGLILAAVNVIYLVGSTWLIVAWKTHVVHPRFMLSAVIIMFAIATLLAFAFLVGVVTSSTAVSIMASYAIFFMSSILAAHKQFEAAVSHAWSARTIQVLYWVFPKTFELGKAVYGFVSGGPGNGADFTLPFLTTALFAVASLTAASWLFHRKEF